MKKLLSALTACFIVSGCATPPMTLNYAPSSTMSVDGSAQVGQFRYKPADEGEVKPNQIRNTALGSVYFEKEINKYIETALFTEARFVGIQLQEPAPTISGKINEFLIDDLGFSVDWTLDIFYEIDDCYAKTHTVERNSAKFANAFGVLNEVIKQNIELLFADPDFVLCIQVSQSG